MSKVRSWYLSIKETIDLIHFLEHSAKNNQVSDQFVSYIRLSRVKITDTSIKVKIRIPENIEDIKYLTANWQQIVNWIARNSGFTSLSSNLTGNQYYYEISGSKNK